MSTTTTIATVTLVAATAVGVAYYTNPQLFTAAPKPAASVAPASPSVATKSAPSAPGTTVTAQAEPSPAAKVAPPTDASKSPAEAVLPASWIGLPVIAADGATVGQVTETRPHSDGRSVVLVVQGSDGKTYDVSSAITSMQGRAVQVAATAAEIGKMVR